MIVEVAGGGAKFSLGQAAFVEAGVAEARVGILIVVLKIETVLDQGSAREGVVADAVAVNPRIQQGEGKQEEKEKPALLLARSRASGSMHLLVLIFSTTISMPTLAS